MPLDLFWKRLLAGTIPVHDSVLTGRVPVNNSMHQWCWQTQSVLSPLSQEIRGGIKAKWLKTTLRNTIIIFAIFKLNYINDFQEFLAATQAYRKIIMMQKICYRILVLQYPEYSGLWLPLAYCTIIRVETSLSWVVPSSVVLVELIWFELSWVEAGVKN